jgi:hypothetical protein
MRADKVIEYFLTKSGVSKTITLGPLALFMRSTPDSEINQMKNLRFY